MVEIYLLEQLTAVKRCGTLSAASKELHLTQPTLSRSMKKLEEQFGVELFMHEKNRISLNDNGEMAAGYAQRILENEVDMVSRVRIFDRNKRTIYIGFIAPGPAMELVPVITGIYQNMPLVSEIRPERELMQGLKDSFYEIVILNHASEDKGLISVKCGSEQLFLSVPPEHPFAYYKEVHFAEMNGESFLMASEVGFWSDIVRNHMPASHFLLQNGTEELSEVVRTSSLPSFVTDISKKYMHENENRIFVPFLDQEAKAEYYLIIKKENRKKYQKIVKLF